jgi:hypothetical protein
MLSLMIMNFLRSFFGAFGLFFLMILLGNLAEAKSMSLTQKNDSFIFKFVNASISDTYERKFLKLAAETHDPMYEVSDSKIRILALVKPKLTGASKLKLASALTLDVFTAATTVISGTPLITRYSSGVQAKSNLKQHIKSIQIQSLDGKLLCLPIEKKEFFVNQNFVDFYGIGSHRIRANEPHLATGVDFNQECFKGSDLQIVLKIDEEDQVFKFPIEDKILSELRK